MRPVRGRRLLAVALVILSAGTALAVQVWPQAQSPASNPFIPLGSAGRIVFSLRNTNTTNSDISFGSSAGSDCAMMSNPVPLLDPAASSPWTIAPGEQMQFVVNTAGLTTGGGPTRNTFFCQWAIQENMSFGQWVGVTFKTAASEDVEVQPSSINFGQVASGDSEDQTIVATSWQTTGPMDVSFEVQSVGNVFTLEGCGSATICQIELPGNGGVGSAVVRCTGNDTGVTTGMLNVRSLDGLTTYASVELVCDASGASMGSDLYWTPDTRTFIGAGSGSMTIDGTAGSITNFSLSGGNGTVTVMPCSIGGCNYAPGLILPQTYVVTCAPSGVTETATLTAMGPGSAVAMATITCSPTPGGAPMLEVTPNQISFAPTAVGFTDTDQVTVTNVGGGTLSNVTLSLNGTDSTHFGYDFTCTQGCSLGAGSSTTFDVTFTPMSHGGKTANLTVTATGSGGGLQTETVTLDGSGTGGVLVVETPPPPSYIIDFGVLPLDSTGSATVTVRNDGNVAILAMLTGVESPYTITSNSTVDVTAFGGTASFDTTCGSNTAGEYNATWTVTAPTAYAGSAETINVLCSIADTNVVVEPKMFDFGEVRVGTSVDSMALSITNPGPGTKALTKLELHEPRAGLSLTPAMTSTTLAPTEAATATLALATGSDTDLTGETVDITIDGVPLALPVRGKVVTPHSRIAPEVLDLGTACVGTDVVGQVRLINDGTATLTVDRPEMEDNASFQAVATGVLWPSTLAPGNEIVVDVSPTNSASGPVTGMLAWNDNVPSQYRVPVTLEYVTSGTALSPRGLDFGQVVVEEPSHTQRINLENCDDSPRLITVKSIRGIKGPIGAWVLDPRVGYRKTLASHEKLAVLVTFTPPARGHYEAEMVIETDSGLETVLLIGDATGRDFATGTFYACSCSAPGAFLGGWPIVVALLVISGRRRRGSSSSR